MVLFLLRFHVETFIQTGRFFLKHLCYCRDLIQSNVPLFAPTDKSFDLSSFSFHKNLCLVRIVRWCHRPCQPSELSTLFFLSRTGLKTSRYKKKEEARFIRVVSCPTGHLVQSRVEFNDHQDGSSISLAHCDCDGRNTIWSISVSTNRRNCKQPS